MPKTKDNEKLINNTIKEIVSFAKEKLEKGIKESLVEEEDYGKSVYKTDVADVTSNFMEKLFDEMSLLEDELEEEVWNKL